MKLDELEVVVVACIIFRFIYVRVYCVCVDYEMPFFSVVLSSSGFFLVFCARRRTIFFFEVEGKIRSFLSFLRREEEFITLKEEEDKEDKEELKKRRAGSFCSRSVSRPLSSSLSAGAKRERESGVFFFKE